MLFAAVAATVLTAQAPHAAAQARSRAQPPELWRQVEIRRTAQGVPHIHAENLRAAAYALAWVQLEDYGAGIARGLLRARGEMGLYFGRDSMQSDFVNRRAHARAIETHHLLDQETRDVYAGFADGVNRYMELHPDEFPVQLPRFTAYDVAARDVGRPSPAGMQRVAQRVDSAFRSGLALPMVDPPAEPDPDEGSNAWAFAPSRTRSGNAVLVRNPHLAWTAGYYEAHIRVPGVLDYYGDFRIGGPFTVIGGFNPDLGWATTNNAPDLDELYALQAATAREDHYVLDGVPLPLRRETVNVDYLDGDTVASESRDFWFTPYGPVVHRGEGWIYVFRAAGDGDYRAGEQFLRMMRAGNYAEWMDAMRMRARVTSSITYADRAGNIYYVWNASLPWLPHSNGGDSTAVVATRLSHMWTRYLPFDSLPQLLNPRGGYVQNSNDPPHFTSLREPLEPWRHNFNTPGSRLGLRTQLSLELIDNAPRMSLEEIVTLKHSPRMLLADRVKPDLIRAVREASPSAELLAAVALLEQWDNTASAESRGSVLFETWWRRYSAGLGESQRYAIPWSVDDPMRTPRGLADIVRARESLVRAMEETIAQHGRMDIPWGDVHRVRRGNVDVPVSGCGGALGCFRVLSFQNAPDGKRMVSGGDGWTLAVEFAEVPRAYSILGYGQSNRPESPHYSDQAEMFARGEMKRVAFTEADIEAATVRRYRPGAPR
jgi:acyl-homoserine-lactone acylase